MIKLIFSKNCLRQEVLVKKGGTLLEAATNCKTGIEGACGGVMACSTCHVILEKGVFEQLPPPTEEELDILDLAFDPVETSRLACQVRVEDCMHGTIIHCPSS